MTSPASQQEPQDPLVSTLQHLGYKFALQSKAGSPYVDHAGPKFTELYLAPPGPHRKCWG